MRCNMYMMCVCVLVCAWFVSLCVSVCGYVSVYNICMCVFKWVPDQVR
jgi:hypothetical protein